MLIWHAMRLIPLAFLMVLPSASSYIDCRTACRTCHENTEPEVVLDVYCSMCTECKERRKEKLALHMSITARPSTQGIQKLNDAMYTDGGVTGDEEEEASVPPGCPTSPPCSESEEVIIAKPLIPCPPIQMCKKKISVLFPPVLPAYQQLYYPPPHPPPCYGGYMSPPPVLMPPPLPMPQPMPMPPGMPHPRPPPMIPPMPHPGPPPIPHPMHPPIPHPMHPPMPHPMHPPMPHPMHPPIPIHPPIPVPPPFPVPVPIPPPCHPHPSPTMTTSSTASSTATPTTTTTTTTTTESAPTTHIEPTTTTTILTTLEQSSPSPSTPCSIYHPPPYYNQPGYDLPVDPGGYHPATNDPYQPVNPGANQPPATDCCHHTTCSTVATGFPLGCPPMCPVLYSGFHGVAGYAHKEPLTTETPSTAHTSAQVEKLPVTSADYIQMYVGIPKQMIER